MFLREVKRENRNGTRVSYLQLVHNDWDPAARTSRTKILYSFGRTDQVDTAAIERLIVSLSRLLDPAAALRATAGSDFSRGGGAMSAAVTGPCSSTARATRSRVCSGDPPSLTRGGVAPGCANCTSPL